MAQANRQKPSSIAVKLSNLVPSAGGSDLAERLPEATAGFQELGRVAKGKRRVPERAAG